MLFAIIFYQYFLTLKGKNYYLAVYASLWFVSSTIGLMKFPGFETGNTTIFIVT